MLPAALTKEPEERGFVADPGASMKKDVNSAGTGGREDVEESYDGDDGQRRGANKRRSDGLCQVYVKELDSFVTVRLLEETPAVLSLGKLCEDHGYSYHWTSGQNHISPRMARESIAK